MTMKALSIRNLPDDVYEALKAMAAANHRSSGSTG
jgi:plasmid stability protein